MAAAILASRRVTEPFGLAGGQAGTRGRASVERRDGRVEELPPTAAVRLAEGDVFVIETPGGGGYGKLS
jgi:5-oxoprolinase (ATP-hydrolysing)